MIVWPAVYATAALGVAALAGNDALLDVPGRASRVARALPTIALIAVAAAARTSGVFPLDYGTLDLWGVVLARSDVAIVVGWLVASSLLPSLLASGADSAFVRGLLGAERRPNETRTNAELAGRVLAPLALYPVVFDVPVLRWALPASLCAMAVAVAVRDQRQVRTPFQLARPPIERAVLLSVAVGMLHISGALLLSQSMLSGLRPAYGLIGLIAAVAGALGDPTTLALALARARAHAMDDSFVGYVQVAALGLWLGRASFIVVSALAARRMASARRQ